MPARKLYSATAIIAGVRRGLCDPQVAAEVGCSPERVRQIRRAVGLPANGRRRWTPAEDAKADAMLAAGTRHVAVAAALGRTPAELAKRIQRRGLGGEYDAYHGPRTREAVWRLLAAGLTQREIAARVGVGQPRVSVLARQMPAWWAKDARKEDGLTAKALAKGRRS